MSADRDEARVPSLLLERYRLGELPEREAERLRERLHGDPDLQRRLEALESSDREIRHQYPPEWLANAIRTRAAGRHPAATPKPRWRPWLSPAVLAAAAALALVLAPRLAAPPEIELRESTPDAGIADRLKGLEPGLILFRRTAEGSEALTDGDGVEPGDVIRVGYRAAGQAYGAIVSIDGRGAITRHLPLEGREAAPLESGETVLLGQAYELDDAPRFERFYFVTSERPFEVASVLRALERAADPDAAGAPQSLPLELAQTSFLVVKGASP